VLQQLQLAAIDSTRYSLELALIVCAKQSKALLVHDEGAPHVKWF
jgi:hypothetical protein